MSSDTPQHPIGSGFGARSTAAEVLDGIDLTGRTAVVTGGYSGIGLETVRALAGAGATVVVPARRPELALEALADLPAASTDELDLADQASVSSFADRFLAAHDRLDLLINNAGVMANPETRVGDGWESQFATNHLGHYALTNRLAPVLADDARVVALTSTGHKLSPMRWDDVMFTTGYDKWLAYGQSKTADALFAVHLHALGVQAFAAHPGGIMTPLQRFLPREEMIRLRLDGRRRQHVDEPLQERRNRVRRPSIVGRHVVRQLDGDGRGLLRGLRHRGAE